MCGLVGLCGSPLAKEVDAFKDLLVFSSVRGPHSTGVAVVAHGKDREPIIAKQVGNTYELFDHKPFDAAMRTANKKLILGHNRHATVGTVNRANAHPFDKETLVGCHNGTIDWQSRKKLEGHDEVGTDSEALFNTLDEFDVKDVIPRIEGAWGLTWYDKNDDTFHMLRNEKRTLFFCFNELNDTLFWASEPYFLHAALARNGVKYKEVRMLPENNHFVWEVPKQNKKFEEPLRETVKGKESTTYSYVGHNSNRTTESKSEEVKKQAYTKNAPSQSPKQNAGGNVVPIGKPQEKQQGKDSDSKECSKSEDEPRRLGYGGWLLNREEFESAVERGCVYCDQDIHWTEPCVFLNHNSVVCHGCSENPDVNQYFTTCSPVYSAPVETN